MDEGSVLSLLYLYCQSMIGLKEELIVKNVSALAGLNGLMP